MHINTVNQIIETIQAYYDRHGIEEKAEVDVKEAKGMPIVIEVNTKKLLTYDHMVRISNILWMLMPIGVMHEFVNVVLDTNLKEQKISDGGESYQLDYVQAIDDPNTSVTMPAVDENGNIIPIPYAKKDRKNK
jgi:hypothetical protein